MMVSMGYKYELDKSSKKFHCPQCGKKRYVRYIDSEGQYLDYQYGRCDREVNCGYFLKPEVRNPGVPQYPRNPYNPQSPHFPQSPQVTHIPTKYLKESLTAYPHNNFVKYLVTLFGEEITASLIRRFFIGTSKRWPGSTCFWQVDDKGKVRQCKVVLYNPETGRRNKDKGAWFAGKTLVSNDNRVNLQQCLYGMHQLRSYDGKPIAIVESEKTAILATVFLPQYVWLATGGKNGAKIQHQLGLKGKKVILFPDLGCYDDWLKKAEDVRCLGTAVTVSKYLEGVANEQEKSKGYDIADYLVKQDERFGRALTEDEYPIMWDR